MSILKLSDFCIPQNRTKIKANSGQNSGAFKFFTSSGVQSRFLDYASYFEPSLIFGTGGNASVHYCVEPFSTSADCLVLHGNGKANLELTYLFLLEHLYLLEQCFKGAGLKHISKKDILNIGIEFPDRDSELITDVFSRVKSLISLRKNQIDKLNILLKSQFMYKYSVGCENYSTWKALMIKEIVKKRKGSIRTGPFGSDLLHSEFVDNGVFVVGIDNAVENRFTWNRMRYISEEKYLKLSKYTVFPRDVLITIMATVGRSAVIPDNFPKAINTKHLACLSLDEELANPYFISYCIHEHPYVLDQLASESKGAIMDGLNLGIIKNIRIPLPSIEKQNEFVDLIHNINIRKNEINESMKSLELYYKSLMSQYMGV